VLPSWREHSDLVNPFELVRLAQIQTKRPFDVMLESKAGDLALLRAREDLARWLPQEQR
jgi:UV DNA damage endonuclease